MNKILLSVMLSVISFTMFFMVSLTGSVDGQGAIRNLAVQFNMPAVIADEDKHSNKDEGNDDDRDEDRDEGRDKGDDSDNDSDHDRNDNDAAKNSNDNSAEDASCVCPPGVRSCVCADGTTGSENGSDALITPNGLRSIHGGS